MCIHLKLSLSVQANPLSQILQNAGTLNLLRSFEILSRCIVVGALGLKLSFYQSLEVFGMLTCLLIQEKKESLNLSQSAMLLELWCSEKGTQPRTNACRRQSGVM